MSVVLMVVIVVGIVAAVGLLAAMQLRNEPFLGMLGLFSMMVAGVVSAVYGVITTT
jgi:hypothetical protein